MKVIFDLQLAVEVKVTGFGKKRGDVDHVRAECALADQQLMVAPRHRQGRLGHYRFADIAFCNAHQSLLEPQCDESKLNAYCDALCQQSCVWRSKIWHCGIDAVNVVAAHKVPAQNLCRFGMQSLITDARQGFLAAKHLEHIEDAGEVDRPVSAARSGCATLPSFSPASSA